MSFMVSLFNRVDPIRAIIAGIDRGIFNYFHMISHQSNTFCIRPSLRRITYLMPRINLARRRQYSTNQIAYALLDHEQARGWR